jgi:hypothetical protein
MPGPLKNIYKIGAGLASKAAAVAAGKAGASALKKSQKKKSTMLDEVVLTPKDEGYTPQSVKPPKQKSPQSQGFAYYIKFPHKLKDLSAEKRKEMEQKIAIFKKNNPGYTP